MHPVQGLPPHWPYFATVHPEVDPVDVLVVSVVPVAVVVAFVVADAPVGE